MTREEAIAVLAESKRQNEVMRDNSSTFWVSHQMADGVKNAERRIAALDLALAALRPVSREQVDKAWRGEWIEEVIKKRDLKGNEHDYYSPWNCSKCHSPDPKNGESIFCSACGAPMTGEAVQMVMERLEALHEYNA